MDDKKNLIVATSLFCIILLKRLIFLNIGVNFEEAKDLEIIIKISNGEVIYKDILYFYGFFGLYINAIMLKVFGVTDILIPRFIVSLLFAASTIFAYKVALRFLSPFWAFFAVLLGFSGLVAREHTYEHIFAFFGAMVALWGGLSYIFDKKIKNLGYAGIASGIALISQPLPIGILAIFTLISLLTYEYFFRNNRKHHPYLVFILCLSIFPASGALYFYLNDALFISLKSMFLPMFSGNAPNTSQLFFIPPIMPAGLLSTKGLAELKTVLNKYILYDFRWWLISILFATGTGYSIYNLYQEKMNKHYLAILFLSGFSMVFEIKRILLYGASPYVSLFPTFVLLIYFGIEKNIYRYAKYSIQIMTFFLFLLYFIYSPVTYYIHYKKNGTPLELKYAYNVIVMPFTHEIYREAVSFVRKNTNETDKIVVADHNSFFYLFSERENIFSENWYIFSGTSFHPFRIPLGKSVSEQLQLENEIIERIKKEKPAIVIIPINYLSLELIERSPFLKYIEKNWSRCKQVGDKSKKTAFDDNINITIFCPSKI